jgi:hypothetical protein
MGLEFEAGKGIEWEPGSYEGYLIRIEKKFKQFTKVDEKTGAEEKEDRSFYIWYFGISEEGFEDVTLTAVSSTSFGPKSKGRAWANAILRRNLEDGEKFTEDDLKGKPVMLTITLKETDRGTFAEIAGLSPVRSKKKAGRSQDVSPKDRELSQKDLQDMEDALGEAS